MKCFHVLEDITEDATILGKQIPLNPALPTPTKPQTPAVNRTLFPEQSASASISESSQAGGAVQSTSVSSTAETTTTPTVSTVRTSQISEWIKVLLTLFMMKNDLTHGRFIDEFIQKFIVEKISERNSVFESN